MADNINFIPANELPTTEAESVEVLCVEDGELKKKSTAVEYDLDIVVSLDLTNSPPPTIPHEVKKLTDFAVLKAKIEAREPIKSRVTSFVTQNGVTAQTNWFNDSVAPALVPSVDGEPSFVYFETCYHEVGACWGIKVSEDNATSIEFFS